jgi:trans-aconitate 2-methyltransferase
MAEWDAAEYVRQSGLQRAMAAFGAVTFVEWTRLLPESGKAEFIKDVLDRYQLVAADKPGEENAFKFYQMDITLVPG